MSARTALIEELSQQPEIVAQKLLDYLHSLTPSSHTPKAGQSGQFSKHWNRFYGALKGQDWDESPDLPTEKREDW